MSVQLPYAILLATGRLIHISEAKNGADCGCICPECRKPLVARQGNEYAHCFAHESDSDCHGALETTLHMKAKEIIANAKHMLLPALIARVGAWHKELLAERIFHADLVTSETRIETSNSYIKPDAVMHRADFRLAIEVFVSHHDPDKAEKYTSLNLPAIEIDLGDKRHTDSTLWPDMILRSAPRRWLYSPRKDAAEAKMREWLERKRAEQAAEAARVAAHEAEEAAHWAARRAEQQELLQAIRAQEEESRQQRQREENDRRERERHELVRHRAEQLRVTEEQRLEARWHRYAWGTIPCIPTGVEWGPLHEIGRQPPRHLEIQTRDGTKHMIPAAELAEVADAAGHG